MTSINKYSILDDENDENDENITGFASKDDNDTEDNTIALRQQEIINGIEIDIRNNDEIIESFNTQDDKKHDIDIDENSSIMKRLLLLFQLAFPCCMSFLLSMMGGLINMVFAGHWCSDDRSNIFAAVSLSGLYTNITFLSLLIGMSSALETLASQYNGAGDYKNVGISYQRSCIVLFGLSIPVYFCWWYSELIFLSVGIDPAVCNIIGNYVRIRMCTIPLDVVNESYRKFISSIGVMRPSLIANITFVTVLTTCNYTFRELNYSYKSIAWAWVIAQYSAAVANVSSSLLYPEVRRCIQPLSYESFRLKEIVQFCVMVQRRHLRLG
jgi:Na+-driven multidrug efflux pump